ncbi:MAG: hypothetical protein HFH60_10325 [Lachnospiraceae bacterium]|jgi:hypothetical protein|nr:hypothetical protein [Lachnospiraceae bacterium]
MKTNFQMIRELNKEYDKMPHEDGILFKEDIDLITEKLCLDEMDILQLRNLRDFVVLFLDTCEKEDEDNRDKISAITCVIDNKIFEKGGEV